MDSTSKFVKLLSRGECVLTHLFVPHLFCEKYASAIPLTVKLIIRNGYEIWVDFDKENERFIGLGYLFSHFSLIGGQALVFEYIGGFNFKVSIFGLDGSEIEYPNIVHHLQTCRPRNISLYDGGWSFASYLNCEQDVVDEVVVPRYFLEVVGHLVPDKLELLVSSGLHVVGLFNRKDCKISGFASICNMLGVSKLNRFNALVLKYVLGNTFHVSCFDCSMSETAVYPLPTEYAESLNGNSIAFEILVQPFHMLPYCHGVDVSVDFNFVREWWNRVDYITAYKDERCWSLQIRKRRDWKRTTIHKGWITFRDDMQISVGDVCVFRWKNDTVHNFNLDIVRAVTHVE
ncbi:hypothetical protein POM88_015540 [Heracleum sosnowskyi]|uniref:TF-B3 domain-containing protein n=1 Tax=Heracleum sosnowskyi TaxID=360622 RepID=A0AAD8MWI0_9APIA|nr:hypothetical protein POM88_015540 [Heracleum sosnowskyi]